MAASNEAVPGLRVALGTRTWRFEPGESISIGRGAACTIVVGDARVSRAHVHIDYDDGWVVRDRGSALGTWLNQDRVRDTAVVGRLTLRLADPVDGPTLVLEVEGPTRRGAVSAARKAREVTVGRALDNDLVINDVLVSRYHARIERTVAGWQVVDVGSRNQTLVNGRPITGATGLVDGDRFTVGGTDVMVRGNDFIPVRTTRTRLIADEVGFSLPTGRSLLSGVCLNVGSGELVAVVGPSGAGKSTLLNVFTGELQPTSGQVSYDGYDIHEHYAAVRPRIGLVPQDDIVHGRLTARRALDYVAKLRLPDDTTAAERRARVAETLADLGMTEHADLRIDRLSGGQRKRVSVALELLTSPSLLLLDEPTSGLDPALDRQIMASLRTIADSGRTVVVVTHNVGSVDECDRVVLLAPGGIPVYTGRPGGVGEKFGTANWADVFTKVVEGVVPQPPPDRSGPERVRPPASVVVTPAPTLSDRLHITFRQAATLAHRHIRLIFADPAYALFLLVVPIALAGLALAVPGHAGLRASVSAQPGEATQILVLLFVGAAFMGGAAAAREVIGERAIFLRERAAGLRPAGYALAKIGVFAMICAVQAVVLIVIVMARKPGPSTAVLLGSGVLEIGVAMWCTALA
ncbi:MAG: ATP-binding cassette domain-containing protein, partial [Pseudonocardiaceae bacterium]